MKLAFLNAAFFGCSANGDAHLELSGDYGNCIDVGQFCETAFSGEPPFSLWGVPRLATNSSGMVVRAVDMRTGATPFLEIYPDVICMYFSAQDTGDREKTKMWFYASLKDFLGNPAPVPSFYTVPKSQAKA